LLRVGPRAKAIDPDAVDFATIEGRLSVDGRVVAKRDIQVHGGKIAWQAAGGTEENRPLWIQRIGAAVGSGTDLRIHIGDQEKADTRLTIGPGPLPTATATEKVVLAVRGDDRVDVPSGRLRFLGNRRQLIDLSVEDDANTGANGIGRHSSAVYYRSNGDHYWYRDGVHADAAGDPGAGGVQLMRLSNAGLHFSGSQYRQLLNFQVDSQSFGIGVQNQTLYQRAPLNFAWYRGGSPADGTFDAGGGAVAMTLDSASRLTAEGGLRTSGNVEVWGGSVDFRAPGGLEDTDPLYIKRVHHSPDRNDLRIVIGDNLGAEDRLVVGPVVHTDGFFREQFVVQNDGTTRVAGDLYVNGRKAVIDVITGEVFLNELSSGSGTKVFDVASRLPRISSASIMVALSDISNVNVATDARWRVSSEGTPVTILPPNTARFNVNWFIQDIDGQIRHFTYVAIFLP
jgi:hypothetical protein